MSFLYETAVGIGEVLIASVKAEITAALGEVPEGTIITLTRDFGDFDSGNPLHANVYGIVEIRCPGDNDHLATIIAALDPDFDND